MKFKNDKSKLRIGTFEASKKESKEYLLSLTPEERLNIVEFLREQTYAESCPRLQRVLEVVYRK